MIKTILSTVGMLLIVLAMLLAGLHIVGTDDALYHRLQLREGVLETASVTDDELRAIDCSMAEYLSGDRAALDPVPFNATERAHMADCFDLFVLLRRVTAILAVLGVLSAAIGRRRLDIALLRGAAIALLLVAALAVWGVIDFDSLFTAFHRLLFTNDLWLLDPATDLLIRICPQGMFSSMAARIALYWAAGVAALWAILYIIRRSIHAKL